MTNQDFLSSDDCRALADRIFKMATSGGNTHLNILSRSSSSLRWARNQIYTGGNVRESNITMHRSIRSAEGMARTNALDDEMLRSCVKNAEGVAYFKDESPDTYPDLPQPTNPHVNPKLWFDSTTAVDDNVRAATAEAAIDPSEKAGFRSAGYVHVAAQGEAVVNNVNLFRYYPYTTAQYSVTVRSPDGNGSGWAGVDWNDWNRIDTKRLAEIAFDKCSRSRNPVAVEPGRYTVILEPQAVSDLLAPLVEHAMERQRAELGFGPFAGAAGDSKIGEQVMDSRLTLSADPMDPDCSFVPFAADGEPFRPVNWIENGVLRELAYYRVYGVTKLGKDYALPNSNAFRLSGGSMTVDEMIANTQRGILVTRFNSMREVDFKSMLYTGTTRDGLWLIEKGKISKPIKNLRFTDSPLFLLNSVEGLGVPQRVFRPSAPAVVPAVMARDFSFTALADAV